MEMNIDQEFFHPPHISFLKIKEAEEGVSYLLVPLFCSLLFHFSVMQGQI